MITVDLYVCRRVGEYLAGAPYRVTTANMVHHAMSDYLETHIEGRTINFDWLYSCITDLEIKELEFIDIPFHMEIPRHGTGITNISFKFTDDIPGVFYTLCFEWSGL